MLCFKGWRFKLSPNEIFGLGVTGRIRKDHPGRKWSLGVTQSQLCVELGARSGRQGAAGVQPEHLAVLGLQTKHPTRTGVSAVRVFVWMHCKPRSKAKNSLFLSSEASTSIWVCRWRPVGSKPACAAEPKRNHKVPGLQRSWLCCVGVGGPRGG